MWVFAHGIAGRADLPIPEEIFGVAAAAVLVVSFLGLAAGWTRPRLEHVSERALFPIPRAVEVVLGALGVAVFTVTAYAGLAGTEIQIDNLAPTAVYVGFWVGIPFLSLLFGDVFRLLSPWRAIGRAVGWTAARTAGGGLPEPLPYPDRLGHWPAVLGILGFTLCELTWAWAREPAPIAVLMLAYAAIQFVGMSLYGVEPWTRKGDAFGVWFGLFARLSPFGRRADGRVVLRPPVAAAAGLRAIAGTVALLIVGIATTGFDGFKEGPGFTDIAGTLQDTFVDLGTTRGFGLELAFVIGLFGAIAVVSVIWWTGIFGMGRPPGGEDRVTLARRFAHALIPIAAAYIVAHYFSLLVYNGQDLWRLASDPLGTGADLFGGADGGIDYGVVTANGIWYVQTGALVAGHVAALVLAHDRALVVYGSSKAATRSQIVMLLMMVGFTLLGLWLLSAALNSG